MTVSVLIPTWRRPEVLRRCLSAVGRQTRRPEQVVVTVRRDDDPTRAAVGPFGDELAAASVKLDVVIVEPVRLTAAMAEGLRRTDGQLVALTDDDAEPHPDWVERLAATLEDPTVGGAGGRDWQPQARRDEYRVGELGFYGRVVGNHHLGAGPPRDVELLKGVNCAFRGDELRRIGFDNRLRGRGNVSHWEMGVCFAFRRAGWRLVYDPAIGVDHHVAQRHDGDTNARGRFEAASFIDGVHNETVALLDHLPPVRRAAFLAWAGLVGTGESPGAAQAGRLWARRSPAALARWRATAAGRMAGFQTWRVGRGQRRRGIPAVADNG